MIMQNIKLLYQFVPDKTFGKLLSVQPTVLIQSKTRDSIFDYIEFWFTDQYNNSLQIEDKVSVNLIIQNSKLKIFKKATQSIFYVTDGYGNVIFSRYGSI